MTREELKEHCKRRIQQFERIEKTMAVRCKIFGHQWRIKQRSNLIQPDILGYPLRLCIWECEYCMKTKQVWIASTECKNDVVLQWYDDDYILTPLKDKK